MEISGCVAPCAGMTAPREWSSTGMPLGYNIISLSISNQVLVEDLAIPLLPHDRLHNDPPVGNKVFTSQPLPSTQRLISHILPETKLLVLPILFPLTCRWGREFTLRGGGRAPCGDLPNPAHLKETHRDSTDTVMFSPRQNIGMWGRTCNPPPARSGVPG